MNEKKEVKLLPRQEAYLNARLSGATGKESARIAGYSKTTQPDKIECNRNILAALDERGLTDEWLANKLAEGAEAALKPGAKDKDINGLAQITKQVSRLRGHARGDSPSVAVQINNGAMGSISESGREAELLTRLQDVIVALESAASVTNPERISDGDTGTGSAGPCSGVGVSSTIEESFGSGGGA